MDLSVLIPARSEEWLGRTVTDVLAHAKGDTEVIVVLDGEWPSAPLPTHPKLQVIHHAKAIGQRAATNLAARVSDARFVMKLDAHCSVAEGFDVELIKAAGELGPDVTQIPAQKNLHIYDVVCDGCGWRQYQGVVPPACPQCKAPNRLRRDVIWRNKPGSTTTSWVFDHQPKFQYDKPGQAKQKDEICDVMSSLGACFFMSRDRFRQIGGLDEAYGSWGSFGIEIACKSWLSGGRHVVNRRTWFSHFFRVGGIGFPYQISGKDQERAREYARSVWFKNAWPKQVRPLSWLLEKFAPVEGWHDPSGREALAKVRAAGEAFIASTTSTAKPLRGQPGLSVRAQAVEVPLRTPDRVLQPLVAVPPDLPHHGNTDSASTKSVLVDGGELVAPLAMGLPPVVVEPRPDHVSKGVCQDQVSGVTARRVVAHEVVEDSIPARQGRHEPGIHHPVDEQRPVVPPAISGRGAVAAGLPTSIPDPASSRSVDADLLKQATQRATVDMTDRERISNSHGSASSAESRSGPKARDQRSDGPSIVTPPKSHRTTASVLYYSDERADLDLLRSARRRLRRVASGLPIIAVTLVQTEEWGADTAIVLPMPRGVEAMAKQILIGLKVADSDVVFFAENDCLYPEGYFDHRPSSAKVYAYAGHTWKVDVETGRTLHYKMEQLSGLCADRALLLDHYRRRVASIERDGFSRRMGFEPGKPIRHGGLDDIPRETWWNERPIVDIRHGANLTPSRWSKDRFRNQRYTEGWTEGLGVPGWGQTAGRFAAFLQEVTT